MVDNAHELESKVIEFFTISAGALDHVKDSILLDCNSVFEMDHRGHIVDVALAEHFKLEFSS